MKLCQVIAIEGKVKDKSHRTITDIYQKLQKQELLSGISRKYQPKDDEGEQLPSESKIVQLTVDKALKVVQEGLVELFDNTATKDFANCVAKANVVVGENVLIEGAPVPYLLFLEKKLADLHTLISKLPTLDPSEKWSFDANSLCFVSEPKQTHRTKKVSKALTLSPATDKHPAQVKEITEDILAGYWTTLNFSGAAPADKAKLLLERVETLQKAVKFAREEANSMEVHPKKVAEKLFNYIFGA